MLPSLVELAQSAGLDPERLKIACETDGQKRIRIDNRNTITLTDDHKKGCWMVPSLHELFRGNQLPPPDMDHYPEEYHALFFFVESQLLTLFDSMGDRTDQELEEVYSALRRRPDGRSLGVTHDFLWQVTALLLGCYALSQAEFEAFVGALLSSTRKWGLRPVSRNYAAYLRKTL